MCRYKPFTICVLFHSVLSIMMIMFGLSMFLFVGGSYPSRRFDITWKWAMFHNILSSFLTVYSAMIIYKEALNVYTNRVCVCLLGILCLSASCLSAAIWPPITKNEYRSFLEEDYKERREVPVFIDWFQFTQGCCGVDNYKDYIHLTGTRLVIETQDISNNPDDIDDKSRPNAEVLTGVVFDIPRSCCGVATRKNMDCGQGIPYTTDDEIDRKVNHLTKGCYKILYDIIYRHEPVQVAILFFVFRTYPILDACLHVIGLCVHIFYYNKVFRFMHAPDDPVFFGKY